MKYFIFVVFGFLLVSGAVAQENNSAPSIPQTTSIQTLLLMLQEIKTEISQLEQVQRETAAQQSAVIERNFYSLVFFYAGFSVAIISGWVLISRIWSYLVFERRKKKTRHEFELIHDDLVAVHSRIEGLDLQLFNITGKVASLNSHVEKLGTTPIRSDSKHSFLSRLFPFLRKKSAAPKSSPDPVPASSVPVNLPAASGAVSGMEVKPDGGVVSCIQGSEKIIDDIKSRRVANAARMREAKLKKKEANKNA